MSPIRRIAVLGLAVAALALAAVALPVHTLPAGVARLGAVGPVVAVVAGAALLAALVPRTPVSIACGLLFGPGLGAACALALTVVAAAVTFAAGRWLGRDFVVRTAGRYWRPLDGWVAREGVLAVAAVRALPLGPYGLVGYAYGASGVRVRDYAWGSLLAGTPSAVTYALLGAAVARSTAMSPLSYVPLATGLALVVALAVRTRRRGVSPRPPTDPTRPTTTDPTRPTTTDPTRPATTDPTRPTTTDPTRPTTTDPTRPASPFAAPVPTPPPADRDLRAISSR